MSASSKRRKGMPGQAPWLRSAVVDLPPSPCLLTIMVSMAVALSPILRMWMGLGPMNSRPMSVQISTKRAFSERNPYPCSMHQVQKGCEEGEKECACPLAWAGPTTQRPRKRRLGAAAEPWTHWVDGLGSTAGCCCQQVGDVEVGLGRGRVTDAHCLVGELRSGRQEGAGPAGSASPAHFMHDAAIPTSP